MNNSSKHKYNLLNTRTGELVLPRNMSKNLCNTWNIIFQDLCTRPYRWIEVPFEKQTVFLQKCLPTDTLQIVKAN